MQADVVSEEMPLWEYDKMPMFQGGGLNEFYEWVHERLNAPRDADGNAVQGEVVVKFSIDPAGTLTGAEIVESTSGALSEEALRVVESSPKWDTAGMSDRQGTTQYVIPVRFGARKAKQYIFHQ
jgi:protein TonB